MVNSAAKSCARDEWLNMLLIQKCVVVAEYSSNGGNSTIPIVPDLVARNTQTQRKISQRSKQVRNLNQNLQRHHFLLYTGASVNIADTNGEIDFQNNYVKITKVFIVMPEEHNFGLPLVYLLIRIYSTDRC